jgi:hypothetical protein
MKKIIIFLIVVSLSSCKEEYLERGSLTQLAESNFWLNERDAQLGLNSVYDALQDRVLYSGNLNSTLGMPNYDGLTDNIFNNYKFEGAGDFMEARLNSASAFFNAYWTSLYKGISRANTAIENISKMSDANISADARKSLLGQAYFLRALLYTNVAVYFEDAPLILKPQLISEAYVPKNSYNEIKAAIISDLENATANLPVSYSEALYGYATKGAALSLLARFQLYNKNYSEVVKLTSQILTLGYQLHPSYEELFSEAGEFSKEIIFSVRFITGVSANGEMFSATFEGIPKVNVQPMPNLIDSYNCTDGLPISKSKLYNATNKKLNRDPRLAASVYFKNDIFLKYLNRAFAGNTATTYGQKKYIRNDRYADGTGVGSPGGQDFYFIRYADVLLMRAEALAQTDQLTEVYTLINQVRARVKMPTIETVEGTNLSKTQLLDIVKQERRVELAFEGLRFFDLKRWGEVSQAYQRSLADKVAGYAPLYSGKKSEVFPIPQTELDANKNLVQNPVWQ